MSDVASRGPEVDGVEDLYRGVTTRDWWVASEGRPSSAAFSFPIFSVDVASKTTIERTLSHLRQGSGIVAFSCWRARELGFDARWEIDANFPENFAHAHVYCDLPKSRRKTRAQELVSNCTVVLPPKFD
jgi:hypothetical protein